MNLDPTFIINQGFQELFSSSRVMHSGSTLTCLLKLAEKRARGSLHANLIESQKPHVSQSVNMQPVSRAQDAEPHESVKVK